jgi:hypothetical protein
MRTVRTKARTTLAAIAAGERRHDRRACHGDLFRELLPAPERTEVGFMGTVVDVNGDGTIDARSRAQERSIPTPS